jgi:tetratricopeptide (TPR) repeat protein
MERGALEGTAAIPCISHLNSRLTGFKMRRFQSILLLFLLCLLTLPRLLAQSAIGEPGRSTSDRASSDGASAEFSRSRQLLQQGKYDEAISELQRISASHPGMKALSHELGVAYYKKADYPRAIDLLTQALREDSADREATQLLGLSYYLSGKPGEAIPRLEKVQEWLPRANVDASYILGECYVQSQDYPHARQAFAKMFDLPPDSAASYLLTARMLFRQEFEPVAREHAEKAIALDPKLPLAHFLLGEIHLFKSQVPEAIAAFQQELALDPGHAATYYKLADAYSRVQKFDDAERLLQRAIWLDPTSTGPYVLMGKVLERKGEPELAIRALQHAATMDPNNYMTHHLLGQAYRDVGKNEDAERELKIANQLQTAGDLK